MLSVDNVVVFVAPLDEVVAFVIPLDEVVAFVAPLDEVVTFVVPLPPAALVAAAPPPVYETPAVVTVSTPEQMPPADFVVPPEYTVGPGTT